MTTFKKYLIRLLTALYLAKAVQYAVLVLDRVKRPLSVLPLKERIIQPDEWDRLSPYEPSEPSDDDWAEGQWFGGAKIGGSPL